MGLTYNDLMLESRGGDTESVIILLAWVKARAIR